MGDITIGVFALQGDVREHLAALAECDVIARPVRRPAERAAAIVKATTFFDDPDVIAKVSRGLGEAMVGINVEDVPEPHRLAERGW